MKINKLVPIPVMEIVKIWKMKLMQSRASVKIKA